jgi:predicted PilT family ATPase
MKDGKFVWRDANSGLDIIRKYIENEKYESYNDEQIKKCNDTAMLLAAEPGMGKSTFLSTMEHEIKKCNATTCY